MMHEKLAERHQMNSVVPIRPVEPLPKDPMRTWFYHELGKQQAIEIRIRGDDMMQRIRDLERLQEALAMFSRWAAEDGTWQTTESRKLADAWWEQEMRVLARPDEQDTD